MNFCFLGRIALRTVFMLSLARLAAAAVPLATISIQSGNRVASDLVDEQNRSLSAQGAIALKRSGKDVSLFDPGASDVWAPRGPSTPSFTEFNSRRLSTAVYSQTNKGDAGEFWFTARSVGPDGPGTYRILASRKSHNYLLRAALLRKLGYVVPQVSWLPSLRVQFVSAAAQAKFLSDMEERTVSGEYQDRWVASEAAQEVVVQDVVAIKENVDFINLSHGYLGGIEPQGRRALNALLLPYALVDVPESVNLFGWTCGRAAQDSLLIPYASQDDFAPDYEDLRWAARKIARLARADFEQIVAEGSFPPEVAALLTEKLVSRRNYLAQLFSLGMPQLPFDEKISRGPKLQKGRIIVAKDENGANLDRWPGYGSRFAYGDFEDPLSFTEIKAFVESAAISGAIQNAVGALNSKIMTTSAPGAVLQKEMNAALNQNFVKAVTTGAPYVNNWGFVRAPYAQFSVNVSRDLVIGPYLGTQNGLQLAESIGVTAGGGLAYAWDLLPSPAFIGGRAGGAVTRTYTHIHPVTMISDSLKKPFRDFLVPLMRQKLGNRVNRAAKALATANDNGEELGDEQVASLVDSFKDGFPVGDSLIISDALNGVESGSGGVEAGLAFYAQAGIFANQLVIGRTHVYRSSENEVQIYRESGELGTVAFSLQFNAVMPIMSAEFPLGVGHARVKFFTLGIGASQDRQVLARNLSGLADVLQWNSTERAAIAAEPWRLDHNFNYGDIKFQFLFFKYMHRELSHGFTVTAPDGYKKKFYDLVEGNRSGKDYEGLAIGTVNGLMQLAIHNPTDTQFIPMFNMPQNEDPGFSLFGESRLRKIEFQGEVGQAFPVGDATPSGEFVLSLQYIWKGFGASREKLDEILNLVRGLSLPGLYPTNPLSGTQKARLYNVALAFQVDSVAAKRLALVGPSDLRAFLCRALDKENAVLNPETHQIALTERGATWCSERVAAGLERHAQNQRKFLAERAGGNAKKMAAAAIEMFSGLERDLGIAGIYDLLQAQGIVLYSRIDGLRYGEEDGNENSVFSNIYGMNPGKFGMAGPWTRLLQATKMLNSELMLNWLITEF